MQTPSNTVVSYIQFCASVKDRLYGTKNPLHFSPKGPPPVQGDFAQERGGPRRGMVQFVLGDWPNGTIVIARHCGESVTCKHSTFCRTWQRGDSDEQA